MDDERPALGTSQPRLLDEIVTWSANQPSWQRDALRRLVQRNALTDEDFDDLMAICLHSHGSSKRSGSAPRVEPLNATHVPSPVDSTEAVTLRCISGVENVNALAQKQTLKFAPGGITVIYGDNGSGKSGYARILRKACRARAGLSVIQPNVFAAQPGGEQSASIGYCVGERELTVQWRPSADPDPNLSRVSFFDSDCARVHVNDRNEVAFRPFGLDLLDSLARCCDVLRGRLQRTLDDLDGDRSQSVAAPPVPSATAVGKLLGSLSEATQAEEVDALCGLDGMQEARLAEINLALGNDPREAARSVRATCGLVAQVRDAVATVVECVSDEVVLRLGAAREMASRLRELAQSVADAGFSGCPLSGVGGVAWRALWEAARRYSTADAYPGEEFPFVRQTAHCVLCQQTLNEDARHRLGRFEAFVREDVQKQATEAEMALCKLRSAIAACPTDVPTAAAQRLLETDQELADGVRVLLASASARKVHLLAAEDAEATGEAPSLGDSPVPRLDSLLGDLDNSAKRLDDAASDEARETLKQEAAELEARRWLASVKDKVLTEIARLGEKRKLETCMPDVDTTKVTRAVTGLSKRFLNDVIRDAFSRELEDLRLRTFSAVLAPTGGTKGTSRYQIQMEQAPDASVAQVASEGEYRVLALAGFLSELAVASEASAIVLDDPVCSLDHLRRQYVAERLVQVADLRQVVVFTHDIAFLAAVVEHARRQQIDCATVCLESHPGEGYGVCSGTLPWEALKVKDRISRLNALVAAARKVKAGEAEGYESDAITIRRLIRQTWERAVEEVLLNGVVERFKPHIHTQRLAKLTDITESDYQELDAAMSRCSESLHDQPAEANPPCPSPEDLETEVRLLQSWVSAIHKRRGKA